MHFVRLIDYNTVSWLGRFEVDNRERSFISESASETCSGRTVTSPARSAIVRATLAIRVITRVEKLRSLWISL